MLDVLPAPRKELSKYAPKIITFTIDPEKIREVIGSGGKVINKIIEETGVKIDIDDDGKVCIATYGENLDNAERAKAIILSKVGAFVELAPGKDGMIHISKMSDKRINQVEDVLNIGDTVKVEIIKIGEKGIDLKLLEKMEG